ncbi:YdcF family protein [Laspinema olomoucense]|uniref:YdcF family protein n=1 Tax=Laspinema olomoucense D3b TaxID=2953688 RepID=A0ABT2N2C6_9CYAN|nr:MULTISPECIES: YdcF family protein [unclassified Laspinema]MCT7970654.1 YdcF family protein [Laspinema sp. D3d]MCT7976843.1 YdcF family protein [Laspinema sp. D3b]
MKQKSRRQPTPSNLRNRGRGKKQKIVTWVILIFFLILSILGGLAAVQITRLQSAASGSSDAILVLGGSIKREMYVTQFAKQNPDIPIVISQGSASPCVQLIFDRDRAPAKNVWLERCAYSTFTNFTFSGELLKQWDVKKVKVITSQTHLPRAKWLAHILLGAKGIAVEIETVQEEGIPGNKEFWLKTALDVTRSLIWAIIEPYYSTECQQVERLSEIDITQWQSEDYQCEHQGQLD